MIQVYIWENGVPDTWECIPFKTYCAMRKSGALVERYFIEMKPHIDKREGHFILECSYEHYLKHKPELAHERYLKQEERKWNKQNFTHLLSEIIEDTRLEGNFAHGDAVFEDAIIQTIMLETLEEALSTLEKEERDLLLDYYQMQRSSMRKLAAKYGVSHQTVYKRLKKLLEKMKKVVYKPPFYSQ